MNYCDICLSIASQQTLLFCCNQGLQQILTQACSPDYVNCKCFFPVLYLCPAFLHTLLTAGQGEKQEPTAGIVCLSPVLSTISSCRSLLMMCLGEHCHWNDSPCFETLHECLIPCLLPQRSKVNKNQNLPAHPFSSLLVETLGKLSQRNSDGELEQYILHSTVTSRYVIGST